MTRLVCLIVGLAATIGGVGLKAPTDDGCCGGELLAMATCTGSASCRACKNCSQCAHCNSGGSCGVCSSGSAPDSGYRPTTEEEGIRARNARIQEGYDRINRANAKKKSIADAIARETLRARQAEEERVVAEAERLAPAKMTLAEARQAKATAERVRIALAEGRELECLGIRTGALNAYHAVLALTTRGYEAATAARRIMALDPKAQIPTVVVGPFAPAPTATEIRQLAIAAGEITAAPVARSRRPVRRRAR